MKDADYIRTWQTRIGATPDGDFGPKTLAASLEAIGGAPEPTAAGFALGATSERRLVGVHPDLVRIVRRTAELTGVPFVVLEGVRTLARQRELVASGASKTLNSRHLTGHAVDIAPYIDGAVSWHWPHYHPLSEVMFRAAEDVGVPVEWGGHWTSFKDGPHWQLPRDKYPA